MAEKITLHSLSTREAVADALYRAVISLDSNNRQLWESSWAKADDISFEMDQPMVGMETINEKLFEIIGPMDTQHLTSNIRIDVADGASTAYMTAYGQNQHFRPGEALNPTSKGLLAGTKYQLDVVKDGGDGLWKIKTWKMQLMWIDGDTSIIGH